MEQKSNYYIIDDAKKTTVKKSKIASFETFFPQKTLLEKQICKNFHEKSPPPPANEEKNP